MFNKKLYKKLLNFRSHSGSQSQEDFRDWLGDYIYENYKDVLIETDNYGNLYVTKSKSSQSTLNCVIAHLDINQSVKTENFSVVEAGDFIVGINNDTGHQIGLGHDDKTGVYFALKALSKFDNIKCFFPLDEEIGCKGSRESNDEFFENVGFMVQLDRRGYNEISQYTNGHSTVTSKTKLILAPILARYNFIWADTISTDVGVLIQKYGIQGTNISCGYMNEHRDNETLNVLRYETCEKFAMSILSKTNDVYYHMPIEKKYNQSTSTAVKPSNNVTTTSTTASNSTIKPIAIDTEKKNISKVVTDSKETSVKPDLKVSEINPQNFKKENVFDEDVAKEDILYREIESLYDDVLMTSDDFLTFISKVNLIYTEWQELDESYDKDVLLARLYTVITDIDFSMETDMLTTKFSDILNSWLEACRIYSENGCTQEDLEELASIY